MDRQRIVIDTDPGQDDAVAILLALASPELEVLGITTVAGNVPLARTTRNALVVCELAGRPEIPVYPGADRPLLRPLRTAEHIHGASGLDGADLPEPAGAAERMPAAAFLVETFRAEPAGSVTLCTLGPLTNVALALALAPDIAPRIRRIVLMGGAYFEVGNVTPAAEFNIHVDPEAAASVFGAGIPLTVLPLDVTHRALTSRTIVEGFRALGTPVGRAVAGWTDFFERYDKEKYGSEGAPLHDPCVIAWLLQPALFRGREVNVEIETASPLTLGMTVVDWWRVTGREPNATFMREVDRDGFFALLTERLGRLR